MNSSKRVIIDFRKLYKVCHIYIYILILSYIIFTIIFLFEHSSILRVWGKKSVLTKPCDAGSFGHQHITYALGLLPQKMERRLVRIRTQAYETGDHGVFDHQAVP